MEKVLLPMRALLVILASATAVVAQTDAREIIRRAAAAEDRNWKVARNYTFSEREKLRYLDSQGRVRSQEVSIHDVTLLDGSPYSRLVARDDRPLPSAEERKEQEKLTRSTAERRDQTAAQRTQRLSEYVLRPEWQREAWRELPNAFDFRLAGEEVWEGHTLFVIEATPHPGYQALSRTAKVFAHLRCKLSVDKQDYHLVKGQVEVVETISVGLFLVRVAKGSHAAFEQTRVNDEVWLPSQVHAFVSARLGLLKVLRFEQELTYSKCHESQPDSPIVAQMSAK
jgi:hypothetical protein